MPATAIDHAVVGASDLDRTISFFEAFGFTVRDRRTIDAAAAQALYGLPEATQEAILGVEGATQGLIRVVATPLPTPERGDFHRGGHALDLYTTDIHQSVAAAEDFGAVHGSIADYPFGPVQLTQAQAMGPDDLPLVFVGINHRLPSVLDDQPDRLHSELHSLVATVDGIDDETAFWVEVVGLEKQSAFPIDVPAVSEFMMLPRHEPIRMSVMKGPEGLPPRFELMEFAAAEGAQIPGLPLVPGAILAGIVVDDLGEFIGRLAAAGATVGAPATTTSIDGLSQRALTFTTPRGVDVEVRERTA